jgi:hypothetical protein
MIANRDQIETVEREYPVPSERDLEIYAAVKIDCRRQVEVAAEFGLCQARVSQIVQAVRNWQMRSAEDDALTSRAGPYVERQLDARRLEWLYENAIQCYRRSCEPVRRERSGETARGEWSSTTTLHAAGNVQCLKLAGKLMELKWKLQDRQPPLGPHEIMMSDLKTIQQWLVGERLTAQYEGRIPKDGPHVYDVVRQTLDQLLGLEEGMPISDQTRRRLGRAAADYEKSEVGDSEVGASEVGEERGSDGAATEPTDTTDSISDPPLHDGYIEDCWPQDVKDFVLRGYKLPPRAVQELDSGQAAGEKTVDISGGSSDPADLAGRGVIAPPLERVASDAAKYEEEHLAAEARALADLRRLFWRPDLWEGLADQSVAQLLSEGMTNLLLKGYTREQRAALVAWQRIRDRRRV